MRFEKHILLCICYSGEVEYSSHREFFQLLKIYLFKRR